MDPFARLLALGADEDAVAVAERLSPDARHELLSRGPVPEALWRSRFAAGERPELLLLAEALTASQVHRWNDPASRCAALLALRDPAIDAVLYARAPAPLRRLVLAGRPEATGPRAEAGLLAVGPQPVDPGLTAHLKGRRAGPGELAPAVVARDPELVAHALRVLSPRARLTSAQRALALLRLVDLGARDAAAEALAATEPVYARVDRIAGEFLAGDRPRADVEAFVLEAATPEALVRRLRVPGAHHDGRMDAPYSFAWGPVIAAHHAWPLDPDALARLVSDHGWDTEVREALLGPAPDGGSRLSWRTFEGRHEPAVSWLGATEDAEALVAGTAPAWGLLRQFADLEGAAWPGPDVRERLARADAEVTRLVRAPLGDDAAAWARLLRLGPDFTGTLEALMERVRGRTGDPGTGRVPAARDSALVRSLLRDADPLTVLRVAATLGSRVVAPAYRGDDRDAARALALADPAIDARLGLTRGQAPWVRREAIRRCGPALARRLFAAALPAPATTRTARSRLPDGHAVLTACHATVRLGRPDLAELVTRRAAVHGVVPGTLLGVDLAGAVRCAVARGPVRGEAELAGALREWERRARAGGVTDLVRWGAADGWLAVADDPGWEAIRRSLTDPRHLATVITARDDAPSDLVAAATRAADPFAVARLASGSRRVALHLLESASTPDGGPSRPQEPRPRWMAAALAAGTLTPAELLERGAPAAGVLVALDSAPPAARADAEALIRGLIARHLAGSADAWALTGALTGEFPGTLADLLATASRAAR